MKLIECTANSHAAAMLVIFNDAIVNSTALYDYKPRTMESMASWFDVKAKGGFPVIGIENGAGDLMGFASFRTFRAWPAYKYSVVHRDLPRAKSQRADGHKNTAAAPKMKTAFIIFEEMTMLDFVGAYDARKIAAQMDYPA